MRTQAKTPVRIEAVKETTRRVDPKNAHHKDNVNVAQGPRTGNTGARPGKRGTFMASKEDAAPLAKVIANAYGERQRKDYAGKDFERDGSIMPDVKPQPRKK